MHLAYSDVGKGGFSPSLTADNLLGAILSLLRH